MLLLAAAIFFAEPAIARSQGDTAQQTDGARAPQQAEPPVARFDASKHATTPDEQREIATLLDDLLQIDKPDFGLVPTMIGSQFAPVPSSRSFEGGIIGIDHGIETSPALRRLVELGPKAIPALLRVLDDETPTKVVIKHDDGFGGMWYGQEVPINAVNPRETEASKKYPFLMVEDPLSGFGSSGISEHRVSRGDVAFVILGQIVNRGYQASRYQPTACQVINSPSHDKRVAEALRAMWSSENPAKMVFDSLLTDYSTSSETADYQPGAAMRLAYYYPAESCSLLASRIDKFDLHDIPWKSEGYEEGWRRQLEINGTDAPSFIASLAWCDDPAVVNAIGRALERTDQRSVVVACLGAPVAKAKSDLAIKKIHALLSTPPIEDQLGPFGDEYNLLRCAVEFWPDRARALFETWLKHGAMDCRRAVIHALSECEARRPWAVEMLAPLLDDRANTGWEYGPDYRRRPIRVCDEAAHALTSHVAGTTFELEGDEAQLDAQIVEIQRAIAGLPPTPERAPGQARVGFESIVARKPIAVMSSDLAIVQVHDFSDAKTIYAAIGYQSKGWAWDTVSLDVATGKLIQRTKIDHWGSGVSLIPPVLGGHLLCYHGHDGGHIVVRDARTGDELQRIQTPFHDGVSFDDPLQVRGLNDIAATADEAWVLAVTLDGALHAINMKSAERTVVWQRPADSSQRPAICCLIPMTGTSKFLLSSFGGSEPPRIWDQASQKMSELDNTPPGAWTAAWGKYACRNMNGELVLWDLDAREPLDFHLPKPEAIASLMCNASATLAVVSTTNHHVYVFDLRTMQLVASLAVPLASESARAVFSADRRSLFWVVFPARDSGKNEEESSRITQVAVFDVSDLTK